MTDNKDLYATITQNPTNLTDQWLMQKKYDVWQQYVNAVSSFNKWDIVEKMRLKTWWVADLDKAINELQKISNLLNILINKNQDIYLDGYKVGEMLSSGRGGFSI